jgi:hypothetical protein
MCLPWKNGGILVTSESAAHLVIEWEKADEMKRVKPWVRKQNKMVMFETCKWWNKLAAAVKDV